MVDGLNEACRRNGLKINIKKTEVKGLTKRSEPPPVCKSIGGVNLSKVNSFKNLRSLVDENAISDKAIRARNGMAKATL